MAAPPALATPDIILALFQPNLTAPITACDLIKSIRAQIPDPTFNPLTLLQDPTIDCTHDGARFTADTMFIWLTDALRETSTRTNWLVEDWWPFAASSGLPSYPLDQRWHVVKDAWAYQRQCYPMPEQYTIYPSQAVSQPLTYGSHRRLGVLEVFFWPNPNITDPISQLTADIGPTDDSIPLVSVVGFQSFGYLRVGGEIIQYNSVNGTNNTLSIARRACSGTVAEVHYATENVLSCSLWIKGLRTPTKITAATSLVEVPEAFLAPLRLHVLETVKRAEQDYQGAQMLHGQYVDAVNTILGDPAWQSDPVKDGLAQVAAYGYQAVGGLAPYGPFGTIVP